MVDLIYDEFGLGPRVASSVLVRPCSKILRFEEARMKRLSAAAMVTLLVALSAPAAIRSSSQAPVLGPHDGEHRMRLQSRPDW